MVRVPKPALHKTIFQARYKAELKFYELLMPAAQRLHEYPHWETDRLIVTLRDFDKHCSVAIAHDSFSYEQDSQDTAMEEKYVQQVLDELPAALQVDFFTRLGYRRQYLIAVDMPFDGLVRVMNLKLFSQDERLRRIMPVQVEDLLYRIDSRDEPYRYHLTIGPVRKPEIPRYVTYNRQHHLNPLTSEKEYLAIIEKYPDVAVFMDLDLYQESERLQAWEAAPFVAAARQKLQGLAEDVSEYLFLREVEA
jgi:hypothetical protein